MDKTDAKTLKTTVHPRWFGLCQQSGRMGETNDCTVKSVALALGIPYRVANARMAVAGRRPRKGVNFEKVTRGVLCGSPYTRLEQVIVSGWLPSPLSISEHQWTTDFGGWNFSAGSLNPGRTPRYTNPDFPWAEKCKTVIGWQRYAPKEGTWIIRTSHHILCVKDGLVGDWTAGRNHRIKAAYRVDNAPAWPEKNLQEFDTV
tara:strand:+ start:1197 stop:1802 length:606 start_codon:yes stop_codon:yes gene_type:complete